LVQDRKAASKSGSSLISNRLFDVSIESTRFAAFDRFFAFHEDWPPRLDFVPDDTVLPAAA